MGFLLPAAAIVILDQATKQLLWHLGKNFNIIDGILRVTLVKNTGAAFGLFQGGRALFVIASIVASLLIAYVGVRTPRVMRWRRFFLGLILGGAVGNLIDRLFAGEVIDFIDMGIGSHRWPVYNVADIAVTVGAVGLIFAYLRSGGRAPDSAISEESESTVESPGERNGG